MSEQQTKCERCGSDSCADPDSKGCSDNIIVKLRAERGTLETKLADATDMCGCFIVELQKSGVKELDLKDPGRHIRELRARLDAAEAKILHARKALEEQRYETAWNELYLPTDSAAKAGKEGAK